MSEIMQIWNEAKSALAKVIAWQDLPNGRKYQNHTFSISLAHCTPPKLQRAGQQSCGGNNYWETEKELDKAVLQFIVSNWDEIIYPGALAILQKAEIDALMDCQGHVDQMQDLINEAKSAK